MKKIVGCLVSLLMVFTLAGCGSKDDGKKEEVNESNKKGVISLEEAKQKYPENAYGAINEPIDDGVVMFKLNGYDTFNEIIGVSDEVFKAENESEYIVVDIDVAASKEPLENGLYSVSRLFYLEDQDGTQYVADDDVTNHIRVKEELLDYTGTINPKVLKKMKVAFNLPKGSEPSRLSIKNEYNDEKWLVAYFK